MVKVVYRKLDKSANVQTMADRQVAATADKKRNKRSEFSTHAINVDARSFEGEFTQVFKRNVARARRENKRILGLAANAPNKP